MSIRSMMKVIAATALFGATGAFAQFAGGNGQPGNPYQITDWLQLAEINNGYLDKHFILMNDLNPDMGGYSVGTNGYTATHDLAVGWYPLGPTGSPFTGSFDGDGYTINGLWSWRGYSEVGLFGVLGSGAEVRNVTVDLDSKGLIGTAPDSQVGGIAGRAAYATLGNVTVRGGVIDASLHAGGIVGNAINTTFEGAFSNLCASVTSHTGSGSAFPAAGGIAGNAYELDFAGATLVNTAGVVGEYNVGGVFGSLISANDGSGATLVNSGAVSGSVEYAGGVIGFMNASTPHTFDGQSTDGGAVRILNTGDVTGHFHVGGVFGYIRGAHSILRYGNRADVTGATDVGGIAGELDEGVGIDECYNAGAVWASGNHVGGIAGAVVSGVTIGSVYNLGTVTGDESVGGLFGTTGSGITGVGYNAGRVTGNGAVVGPVAGQVAGGVFIGNAYFDSTTSGVGSPLHGIGYPTADMITGGAFCNALFGMFPGDHAFAYNGLNGYKTYPYFAWQTDVAEHVDLAFTKIVPGPDAPGMGPTTQSTAEVTGANQNNQIIFNHGVIGDAYADSPETVVAGVLSTGVPYSVGVMSESGIVAFVAPPTYPVTMNVVTAGGGIGGTATPVSGTEYAQGATVTLTATPNPGYVFKNWTSNPPNMVVDPLSVNTSLTMPGYTMTISAHFALELTTTPTISGDVVYGEELTASMPGGETVTWQWQYLQGVDWVDLANATNATHELNKTEFGKPVRVVATGTGNYAGPVNSAATANVAPRPVYVEWGNITPNSYSKVYDGTTFCNVKHTGPTLTGLVFGDNVTVTGHTVEFADKNVGNNKPILVTTGTMGGQHTGYYVWVPGPTAQRNCSITPLSIGWTLGEAEDKEWDGTTAATVKPGFEPELIGVIGNDDVTPTVGTIVFTISSVGTHNIDAFGYGLTGADAGNYSIGQPPFAQATITQPPPNETDVHVDAIRVSTDGDVDLEWAYDPVETRLGITTGYHYVIEVCTNLNLPNWTTYPVSPVQNRLGDIDRVRLLNNVMPVSDKRFFRVKAVKD